MMKKIKKPSEETDIVLNLKKEVENRMMKRLKGVLSYGFGGISTSQIVEKRQEVVKILTDSYSIDVDPAVKDSLPFTSEKEKLRKILNNMAS